MKGVDVTERKPLTRSKIGVLMGGQSSEREVSLKTGEAVYRSLVRSGYDAVAIDVGPDLSKTLQEQAVEIGFLALHGPGGEDGAIQGFLETLGIPYTGSGVRASAIGMHKVVTKTELAAQGIPVPRGTVVFRVRGPTSRARTNKPEQPPTSTVTVATTRKVISRPRPSLDQYPPVSPARWRPSADSERAFARGFTLTGRTLRHRSDIATSRLEMIRLRPARARTGESAPSRRRTTIRPSPPPSAADSSPSFPARC